MYVRRNLKQLEPELDVNATSTGRSWNVHEMGMRRQWDVLSWRRVVLHISYKESGRSSQQHLS